MSAFRVVRLVAGNARLVAANPQLRRVLVAWGVGIAGEWAFLVVLSVTAYERGGAAAVGIVGAVRVVPAALAAPLGSTLIDRLPRARVLVAVELAWSALVGLVPLALLADSLVPLYLVVGVSSVVSSVFRPAVSALIPQVVERPEELTAANSLYSTLEALGTLLGPLLAGVLIQTLPTSAVYAVTAVVVALPAILVVRIRTTAKAPAREPAQLLRRLLEPLSGFSTLFGNRSVGSVVTVFVAQCVMRGLLNVYVIVAAVGVLGVGRAGAGPLFAALGVGGLLGALLALATSASRRLAAPFVVGMTMWGLPVLVAALVPKPLVAWLALMVVGVGNAVADVNGFTVMHRLIPDHRLGRAFGAFWGSAMAGVAVGSIAAAPLIDGVGLLAGPGCGMWTPTSRSTRTGSPCSAACRCSRRCPGSRSSTSLGGRPRSPSTRAASWCVRASRATCSTSSSLASCRCRWTAPSATGWRPAPASARSPCCTASPAPPPWSRSAPPGCSGSTPRRSSPRSPAIPARNVPPGPSPKSGSPKRTSLRRANPALSKARARAPD